MDARQPNRIETYVERLASALFAGAVAYAVYGAFGDDLPQPELGFGMAVAAFIAFSLSLRAMGAWAAREPRFKVASFQPHEVEVQEPDELLLTDADRLAGAEELVLTDADRFTAAAEPLVLDDVLAELAPDSRVVRLFDRRAMPTPGQLKSRIDNHLHQSPASAHPDAAQALSDALAELRRSLR